MEKLRLIKDIGIGIYIHVYVEYVSDNLQQRFVSYYIQLQSSLSLQHTLMTNVSIVSLFNVSGVFQGLAG